MKFYQEKWFCILMLIIFFPAGIFLMFRYKHFNKVARIIIITVFFALSIVICSTDTDSNMEPTQNTEITQNQNQIEIDNEELLKQIKVSAEIQDIFNEGKQKVVFNVKNESDYTFDGNISVKLKDSQDKTIHRDIIFVEKLDPGHQTHSVVWAKPGSVKYEYSASGSFTQFTSIFQESIDNFKNKLSKIDTPQTKNFEIIHTEYTRYDGAPTYYVLIDEVNLDNDNFKEEISNIIIVLLKEYGTKINVEFFDNSKALDFHYQKYVKMQHKKPDTEDEKKLLTRHYIASFMGENEVAFSPYDIMFFPSAFTDTPEVGKYVEIKEFTLD